MNTPIPTKKTGMALVAMALLALAFFLAAPSVSSVEAAAAIAQKVQGCTGSSQPFNPIDLYSSVFKFFSGLDGWTVKSFSVSSFSYTNSTGLKVTGLQFIGSYFQSYHYGVLNGNKSNSYVTVYEGSATISIASLSLNRNSTTFSASMTGLAVNLHAQDNSTNVWRHTTISGSNSDFALSWSCTQG